MRLGLVGIAWVGWSVLAGCEASVPSAEEQEQQAQETALVELGTTICAAQSECTCAGADECSSSASDTWRARAVAGHDRGLVYDDACVAAIGDAVDAAACDEAESGVAHPCHEYCAVFHGERGIDETCERFDALVSDCEQGLLCEAGRCVEACSILSGLQPGQPCRDPDTFQELGTCAEGLFCDDAGRCAVPPPVGSACEEYPDPCGPDAWCHWETQMCTALPREGESCDESPDCAQGLACRYSDDYGSSRCVAPGEAGDDCRDRPCGEGLWCDNSDVCRSPGELGESCDDFNCREGLVCNPDLGWQCDEPPAVGQSCDQGVCAEGAWCDFMTDPAAPTCVAAAANGEACMGHSRCTSGYCPVGYCVARPAEGEDCSELFICASGLACDGSTCRASITAGPAVCVYEGW
jgi:hypothetical protein